MHILKYGTDWPGQFIHKENSATYEYCPSDSVISVSCVPDA